MKMKLSLVQTRANDGGGKPMFDIVAEGKGYRKKVGEVYYNTRGFQGYFKLPHHLDSGFSVGEGSLTRVQRELKYFQRNYQPTVENPFLPLPALPAPKLPPIQAEITSEPFPQFQLTQPATQQLQLA